MGLTEKLNKTLAGELFTGRNNFDTPGAAFLVNLTCYTCAARKPVHYSLMIWNGGAVTGGRQHFWQRNTQLSQRIYFCHVAAICHCRLHLLRAAWRDRNSRRLRSVTGKMHLVNVICRSHVSEEHVPRVWLNNLWRSDDWRSDQIHSGELNRTLNLWRRDLTQLLYT